MVEDVELVTKDDITTYINNKPHIHVFPYGQFWKVRIGERSVMEGKYTNKDKAQRALHTHVGTVIERTRKQQARREAKANAKKTKS